MCSGVRFVKTAASKSINLCLCCFMPSEVTSSTAYLQPAATAYLKNFCRRNRPGIVIFKRFGLTSPLTLNRTDDNEATLNPASLKIWWHISTTVDLPLVPVTPITTNFREGNPYKKAPTKASAK